MPEVSHYSASGSPPSNFNHNSNLNTHSPPSPDVPTPHHPALYTSPPPSLANIPSTTPTPTLFPPRHKRLNPGTTKILHPPTVPYPVLPPRNKTSGNAPSTPSTTT